MSPNLKMNLMRSGLVGLILIPLAGCMDPVAPSSSAAKSTSSTKATPTLKPTPKPSLPPGATGDNAGLPYGVFQATNSSTTGSSAGSLTGFVNDSTTPGQPVKVEFYYDGPMGMVTLGGNATSAGGYFNVSVPAGLWDGKIHRVWAYAVSNSTGTRTLFQAGPYSFFVGQTAAGKAYFDSTVRPAVASCNGCHNSTWSDYFTAKSALSHPSKFEGGTASDNSLIRAPSGLDGHGGGNVCRGGSPCTTFSTWWGLEFN